MACRNGLLDVSTRKLHDHTPAYFNEVAVPFDYTEDAPEPTRWLAFLDQLWPDDPDAIAALAEWLGYVVSGGTHQQKILLLVGPTRSGKGTIARIAGALLGRGNFASPTLASLATNFGLQPLIGRPLAIVSDARLSAKTDVGQVVERLLSVSGEDSLTIDRKYREPWTGKLPTRFMLLSNELPRLGDASGAVANRFIVMTTQQSFLGREDTGLTAALLTELPGILNWALDGLDRLTERGAFPELRSSNDAIAALADLTSPTSAFVRDCCQIGGEADVDAVFARWCRWAMDNGHRSGSVQTFGRDLRAAVPALRVVQRRVGAAVVRRYLGLRFAEPSVSRDVTRAYPLSIAVGENSVMPYVENNGESRVTSRDTPTTPEEFMRAARTRRPQ